MNRSLIGLISDTHGLLRPEAIAALSGCDRILHAGDIGGSEILRALARIAPVAAVRGNNDRGTWADRIPATRMLRLSGRRAFLVHDRSDIDFEPVDRRIRIVVSGHSHQPKIEQRDGVLYVNPGSAGPRRFRLPVTVALLRLEDHRVDTRIIDLRV